MLKQQIRQKCYITDIANHSRCSTVLRATIKVNGKPQILGTLSPQTPESIELKSDSDDYVSGLTLRAKNGTNQPSEVGRAKE